MTEQKMKKLIGKITPSAMVTAVVCLVILTPFCIGKYCELSVPGAFDSGANVYSAHRVLEGAVIGSEEVPSAKVGTLLLNMLGIKLFGYHDFAPKLVQGIFQLLAIAAIYLACRKFFGKFAAFIAAFSASFYASAPVIAKYGNVKEEFMAAFAAIGIAALIAYYCTERKLFAVIAGGFIGWAPLFKVTGFAAGGAAALLWLLCLALKWRGLKQSLADLALLAAGFALITGPVWLWLGAGHIQMSTPYDSALAVIGIHTEAPAASETRAKVKQAEAKVASPTEPPAKNIQQGYAERTRSARGYDKQAPVIMRYYGVVIFPIALAVASIIALKARFIREQLRTKRLPLAAPQDIAGLLLCLWWLIDMSLVWVSTRPYEEYYIPLTVSGSFFGAYAIWKLCSFTEKKGSAFSVSLKAVVCAVMMIMIAPVWGGLKRSPYSGKPYDENGTLKRGYVQRLEEVRRFKKQVPPWVIVGKFINVNTAPDDRIYVWGWYPGIYVVAERSSTYKKAFESEMHTRAPETIKMMARGYVRSFEKYKPKYIVDSRKIHFPYDRPPLEFWPATPNGFLPADERVVAMYEEQYAAQLADKIEPAEAERFAALADLRRYIRENYEIVYEKEYSFTPRGPVNRRFGNMVVFRRKDAL